MPDNVIEGEAFFPQLAWVWLQKHISLENIAADFTLETEGCAAPMEGGCETSVP